MSISPSQFRKILQFTGRDRLFESLSPQVALGQKILEAIDFGSEKPLDVILTLQSLLSWVIAKQAKGPEARKFVTRAMVERLIADCKIDPAEVKEEFEELQQAGLIPRPSEDDPSEHPSKDD